MPKTQQLKPKPEVRDIKVLNTIGRSPANLQQAWLCLQQCKTLHAVRRYSFPDCWQQAVGKGVLVLEGPLEWTTKVVSELRRTGYWRVGKRCLKCGAVSDKTVTLIHSSTCEGATDGK